MNKHHLRHESYKEGCGECDERSSSIVYNYLVDSLRDHQELQSKIDNTTLWLIVSIFGLFALVIVVSII